jgi:hypothetical protein
MESWNIDGSNIAIPFTNMENLEYGWHRIWAPLNSNHEEKSQGFDARVSLDVFTHHGDGMWDHWRGIPSGYVKIAIENGHRNSGFSH